MVEFLKWTRELRDLMRMKVMMVHYVSHSQSSLEPHNPHRIKGGGTDYVNKGAVRE